MPQSYTTVATFESKSKSERVYTVKVDEAGCLSCDCPSWTFNHYGDRTCYHTKSVVARRQESGALPAVTALPRGRKIRIPKEVLGG